jgi:hypothetical protein
MKFVNAKNYSGLKFRLNLWWIGFVARVRIAWCRLRYGIIAGGLQGSHLPRLGRGKYVDVIRRGDFIDIRDHHDEKNPFTIRLIPYQPNHGIMVEYNDMNGNVRWRGLMDSRKFLDFGIGSRGVLAPLPKRKPYPKTKHDSIPDNDCCVTQAPMNMKEGPCQTP